MEYIILYFSGTGNTELVAEEIKKQLESSGNQVELVSIEDEDKLNNLDFSNKIIGFGYPVYKFSYPDIFNKILPKINQQATKNKYFQFSTYARFAADAFYDFSKQLDKNNFTLITEQSFKSPSCGISSRKSPNDYEYQSVMFFEDNIDKKISNFVENVMQQKKIVAKQKFSIIDNLKKKIVKDIEITKYPRLQIDNEKCIMCELCVKKCPDNNLILSDSSIKIADRINCLHCLRCINHCPANAIAFGKLTQGNNQYTIKIRNEMFEKSSNGYTEKYWSDFDNVVKKWRKNTLKYWLKQKLRKN